MESKFKTESGLTNDKYCIMFMKRKLITYSVHFSRSLHDFLYTLVSSFGLVSGHSHCKKNIVLHCRLHYIDFLQTADLVKTNVFVRNRVEERCYRRPVVASSLVVVAVAFVTPATVHPLVADKTAKTKEMALMERMWFVDS